MNFWRKKRYTSPTLLKQDEWIYLISPTYKVIKRWCISTRKTYAQQILVIIPTNVSAYYFSLYRVLYVNTASSILESGKKNI